MTNEDAARRRIGVTAALAALVVLLALISLGIGPVRLSPLSVIEALFGGGSDVSQVIVREIRLPRTHPGAGDRRDPRAVRRGAAGPAAQPAGLAVAVRRAAIGRLRRGAGDRARPCRRALLCAAGGGDHRGVRLGVRAADDRGPQCRAADPDPGGPCDLEPRGRRHRAGDESLQQSLCRAGNCVLAARLAGGPQLPARHAGAAVHRRRRAHPVQPAQRLPRAHASARKPRKASASMSPGCGWS